MTPPMTPREKVDCVACEGRPALQNNPCVVCGRTALASGSGDHAELARLAEAKQSWSLGIYKSREQANDAAKFNALDLPATVLALLAENAALREKVIKIGVVAVSWQETATDQLEARAEAERKLAEAVGLLREIAKGETPPEQHGHYRAHRQAVDAARTFLSEAHQTREKGRGIWQ